ncbi:MAG: GNAT family N-acetyltransferase [Candidatus Enterenecus sp.]
MIHLEEVNGENWRKPLYVTEEQRHFVADTTIQLARAWAYRDSRSQARMVYDDDTPVGMLLYYDWDEGKQYVFSQLLIDRRYQGRGFGERAARLALDEMRADGRYDQVCLCYVEGDEPARRLYEKLGFVPTGEVDGDEIIMVLEHL